jgi:type III secretion protein U
MSTDDKSQKTEKPTNKKLTDARKKGQVSKSKDIVSTLSLAAVLLLIWLSWNSMTVMIEELIIHSISAANVPFEQALSQMLDHALLVLFLVVLPIIGISFIAGVIGNIVQVGFLFAGDQIAPKFSRINPISGFKRIFGLKNFMEFIKSFIKLLLLIIIISWAVSIHIQDILRVVYCDIYCVVFVGGQIVGFLSVVVLFFFLVMAILDACYQKYEFLKDQRMSKEEQKQERKNMDGDPLIKSQRRVIQKEISDSDISVCVKELYCLIIGHNCVLGLRYEKGQDPLPMVTVKGDNAMSRRVIPFAKKYKIPIFENDIGLKEIWTKTVLNQYIPSDIIPQIARLMSQKPR